MDYWLWSIFWIPTLSAEEEEFMPVEIKQQKRNILFIEEQKQNHKDW